MINIDKIIIRRPRIEDIDLINEFFIIALKDTFEVNGISNLEELLKEEIQDKKRCINQDLKLMELIGFFF